MKQSYHLTRVISMFRIGKNVFINLINVKWGEIFLFLGNYKKFEITFLIIIFTFIIVQDPIFFKHQTLFN
jgi:hypothetical protein